MGLNISPTFYFVFIFVIKLIESNKINYLFTFDKIILLTEGVSISLPSSVSFRESQLQLGGYA